MKKTKLLALGLTLALSLTLSACFPFGDSGGKATRRPANTTNTQVKAQMNLGAALLMEGQTNRALEELLKAKDMDPKNADIENFLGLAYYGMQQYPLAIESYQNALKLNPKRSDVHNNLGLVYLDQQNYEQALNEFNACLQDLTYQKKQLPLTNIGLTYMDMGDYEKAMAALTRATEVAPDYAKSYYLIARIHQYRDNHREAIDYFNNAIKLDPGSPDSFMLLGDSYAALKRSEDAAQAYGQAAALVPNTPLALEAQKKARQAMGFD